jgi:cobalamin-dependent methionine synthase I
VNSISLKVGEELFNEHATLLRKHGAAVVVVAIDALPIGITESCMLHALTLSQKEYRHMPIATMQSFQILDQFHFPPWWRLVTEIGV